MTDVDDRCPSHPSPSRRPTGMAQSLERGRSAVADSPWRWRRPAGLGALGVAACGAVLFWLWRHRELDCITASRSQDAGITAVICKGEYERTRRPVIGAYLADALRRAGQNTEAAAIANDLLATELRGDALQTLAKIAMDQERTDDAIAKLQEAGRWHREHGSRVELARDDQALAKLLADRGQYAESLQMLDECITESHAAEDELVEGSCHLTAARPLVYAGFFDAAHQELDRAEALGHTDRDLADIWFWRGNLDQERVRRPELRVLSAEANAQAVWAFKRSLEHARRARLTSRLVNIHLNLAYSFAESRRPEEADRELAEAAVLDQDRKYESERMQLAARIAYRRGNLTLAASLNERVYPTITDPDDQLDVAVMQARIALDRNDLELAQRWAMTGVDSADNVRARQTLSELRPWVLARRREPFEALFTALARAGRADDAASVFDRWQGRTLLDAMARPNPSPSPRLLTTAIQLQSFARWLPVVSRAPLMASGGHLDRAALATIDLLALALADGHVWRVIANHGRFRLDDLGSYEQLDERISRFVATPTDAIAARELGDQILPDELVYATAEPLYVVLDEPLARWPFVGLRHGDQLLIALRPVLRAPRIPTAGTCGPRGETGSTTVLADAAGDLPFARRESSKIASMFGTAPLVGAAATSAALFAARSDALLHIAVHAEAEAGGGVLRLYDRAVLAPEISASQIGPPLVVLSACSTATAGDPELAGALSTAFLAAGSHRVVATLRGIADDAAQELTSEFYEDGGARDPVHALARIQTRLARGDNKEWPYYAVYGAVICDPTP